MWIVGRMRWEWDGRGSAMEERGLENVAVAEDGSSGPRERQDEEGTALASAS